MARGTGTMLPVDEARQRILAAIHPWHIRPESIALVDAANRVLAADLAALRTQPPFDVSAMDGFALIAADTDPPGKTLRLIGESAAGRPFAGRVSPGEATRIYTGARVPDGADAVLLQERAKGDDLGVSSEIMLRPGQHIRRQGLDFWRGDALLRRGQRLTPARLALAAAMDHAELSVAQRPRIALLATGDELAEPGQDSTGEAIIASNLIAIAAMIEAEGGEAIDLGIARDTPESLESAFRVAIVTGADCLVTIGGASVGRHDLVRPVAASLGARLDFFKIAMRPGKPLNFGSLGEMLLLGLPGNPVSAMVCATLFLRPLVRALQGMAEPAQDETEPARLEAPLPANDERQDYLRVTLARADDGSLLATPLDLQDSSLLSRFARADALLIRPPHAKAVAIGDICPILRI